MSPKFVWQIVWQLFKNASDLFNINDSHFPVSPWMRLRWFRGRRSKNSPAVIAKAAPCTTCGDLINPSPTENPLLADKMPNSCLTKPSILATVCATLPPVGHSSAIWLMLPNVA